MGLIINNRINTTATCLCFVLLICSMTVHAADKKNDSHYTAAGFFDIHVCNWPDRPPFYLALFGSERFAEIESVRVDDAEGNLVTYLNLKKYRTLDRKNKPEKRVFLTHTPIPGDASDGWFQATVRLKNGESFKARDYVQHELIGRVSSHKPADGAEMATVPVRLEWAALPGAGYYQVFIRDIWNDEKLIFSSKLIRENLIELKPGLLEPGGLYAWKVHARDVDGDIKLGDFNAGSQSEWVEFSIE